MKIQRKTIVHENRLPSLTGLILRQTWWKAQLAFSLLALTACAAYVPPPLTMAHPAHPDAVSTAEPPPSNTLAYEPSERPSTQPAVAMAQGGAPQTPASTSEATVVVGEGKVIAVVPSSGQIVVDHQEIKGFMDAMTMGYRVVPPSLLEAFKAGDNIQFTIDTQEKAIVQMEKMDK